MSDNLIELAARCEAADGPDRELDALIACVAPICTADYVLSATPSIRKGMVTRCFNDGGHGTFVCERYTSSLDAAMQLVPEGWRGLYDETDGDEGRNYTELFSPDERPTQSSCAKTLALSICAASLRARAADTRTQPRGDSNG